MEKFTNLSDPDQKKKVRGFAFGNYEKLGTDGIVEPGTKVFENDIVIGKVTPILGSIEKDEFGSNGAQYKDASTGMRSNENGVTDKVLISTNSDGYKFTKVRVRSVRIPQIGDKFACFSQDHEVLTLKGWVPVYELTKKHKIASLIEGSTLKYDYPTEIMEYDFDGKMYNVESNQVSLCVTPNHRMWVSTRTGKYKIEKAEDVYGKRRKYYKTCENYIMEEKKPKELSTKDRFKIYDENGNITFDFPLKSWLKLFGIWIAEGNCYFKGNSCYVHFASNKERVRNTLDEIEKDCSLKFSKYTGRKDREEGNTAYRISNKNLASYFNSLNINGAINKDLPNWVWYLNQDFSRILIDGMMLGDGHIMKNGTKRYDTSSTKLRDAFQRLCLHAGYSTNYSLKYKAGKQSVIKATEKRREEVITSNYDAWRLTVIEKQNNPLVNKNIKTNGDNRLDNWVDYNGKVYCCTVPSGIIYVRRNGKPVWCGNSRHGRN
jgi:hypothetical protein